jgi:hypothetical protein
MAKIPVWYEWQDGNVWGDNVGSEGCYPFSHVNVATVWGEAWRGDFEPSAPDTIRSTSNFMAFREKLIRRGVVDVWPHAIPTGDDPAAEAALVNEILAAQAAEGGPQVMYFDIEFGPEFWNHFVSPGVPDLTNIAPYFTAIRSAHPDAYLVPNCDPALDTRLAYYLPYVNGIWHTAYFGDPPDAVDADDATVSLTLSNMVVARNTNASYLGTFMNLHVLLWGDDSSADRFDHALDDLLALQNTFVNVAEVYVEVWRRGILRHANAEIIAAHAAIQAVPVLPL